MIDLRNSLFKSEHIYSTGDNPILITCDDFSDWVCKHGRLTPLKLFNEIIASNFAEIWNIKTPNISLINVAEEHIPENHLNSIQPAFFRKPCFGSLFLNDSIVVDNTILPLIRNNNFKKKIANKSDYLKIALFDIWIANEDRHRGNSNLLLDQSNANKYSFTVFDHGAIFNTSTLNYGLQLISDDESLICTEISKILFSKINNLTQIVDNIVEDFYLCVEACRNNLQNILEDIPEEWNLNIIILEENLRNQLFNHEWFSRCERHFRTLIQANIK